jgi:hypothetical protein
MADSIPGTAMILTSIVDPDGTSGEPYDPTKAGPRHRVGMMTQASFDAGLARIDEP